MNMKPSKEEMMKQLLSGLEKIEQVEPSPFLYAKIRYKIEEKQKGLYAFSHKVIWKTSLAFVFLLILNVVGISMYSKSSNTTDENANAAAEEYGLTTDNDYYNY